jgi:outer membrane protein OmpA-like peptidoglycan-associated protein
MYKTLRTGLILLLMIPSLMIIQACANKTGVAETESSTKTSQLDSSLEQDFQKDLEKKQEKERQQKEAEQRLFRAAKRQFIIEDIYFRKGSYRLQPEARTILYRKADFLKKYPEVTTIIEGHTNERGSKSFLIKEGIDRERLIAVSFGKERPVDTGPTEKARAKNRRVHFVVQQ